MMRERLIPLALATASLLVAAACTSDGSTSSDSTNSPATSGDVSSTAPANSTVPSSASPRPQPAPGPQGFASANLEFFGDCDALLTYMQTEATERVTAWGLGGGIYYGDGREINEMAPTDDAGGAVPESAPAPGAVEGQDYSGTNTQEVGVDEGDIVETDGDHVYVANSDGLRVVAVADADVVAEPELPQGSHQLLLDGDRRVVATSSWGGSPDPIVSLFEVADPANPDLLRRSHLEGGVVATRSVDGVARLVITTSFDQRLPFVQPARFGLDEDSALARNKEIIAESTVQDWLPRWFDEDAEGGFGPMSQVLPCETVAAPPEFAGLGLTWIGSIDVNGDGTPVGSAGIVSTGDTVYASTANLYVATQNWDWRWGGPMPVDAEVAAPDTAPDEDPGPPPTLIHQFRLDAGTGATYVASGQVEGRLLNQFAMSEFNGDLRVATTTDDWGGFGDQSESTVFVLRPEGDELRRISSVGGLGKDEQIYAVRFIDDLAYVVTFRQIDPLYVIDLSDPANPVEAGELKIPGYSAYLHPVGDGLLLGVGQDATDAGRTTGTQLSLFDVTDPTNPQRISTLPIGGYSEVEWDHKAFLFWPEDGTIVLPVSPGWNDCGPDDDCLAKGLAGAGGGAVVAELDGRELSARGTITHSTASRSGCWNPLQRSIVIGDELVTVGLDQMKFSDRQSLEPRDSVSWGDPEQYGCYWYVD
ncbi:MAG TPA: beta-propeller domain-containing protein [Ilumatobacteraceae bacterium]|nr:beta-propeller domain-containing protein [Ilumatobacteraceae bacterium]